MEDADRAALAKEIEKLDCGTTSSKILLVGDTREMPNWAHSSVIRFHGSHENLAQCKYGWIKIVVVVGGDWNRVSQLQEQMSRAVHFWIDPEDVEELRGILAPLLAERRAVHVPVKEVVEETPKRSRRRRPTRDEEDEEDGEEESSEEVSAEQADDLLETLTAGISDGDDGAEVPFGDGNDDEDQEPAGPEEDAVSQEAIDRVRRALDLVDRKNRSRQVAVFGLFEERPLMGYSMLEPLDVDSSPIVAGNKLMDRIRAAIVLTECSDLRAKHVQDDLRTCKRRAPTVEWVFNVTRGELLAALVAVFGAPVLEDETAEQELVATAVAADSGHEREVASSPRVPAPEVLASAFPSSALGSFIFAWKEGIQGPPQVVNGELNRFLAAAAFVHRGKGERGRITALIRAMRAAGKQVPTDGAIQQKIFAVNRADKYTPWEATVETVNGDRRGDDWDFFDREVPKLPQSLPLRYWSVRLAERPGAPKIKPRTFSARFLRWRKKHPGVVPAAPTVDPVSNGHAAAPEIPTPSPQAEEPVAASGAATTHEIGGRVARNRAYWDVFDREVPHLDGLTEREMADRLLPLFSPQPTAGALRARLQRWKKVRRLSSNGRATGVDLQPPSAADELVAEELLKRLDFASTAVRLQHLDLEEKVQELYGELWRHTAFEEANLWVKQARFVWEGQQQKR